MVNYIMEINHSGGTLTFPITPKFFPSLSFTWKRDGKEVAVIDSVPVEGWFSDNDQDVVIGLWDTLRGVAQNGGPTTFIFKKTTGGIIYQYNRAHIQNLEAIDQGGGFVNHVGFRFNIQEERGVTFANLVDVTREDTNSQRRNSEGDIVKTFRRTVSATGEFGNLAPALSFVKALKPTAGDLLSEDIREVFFDGLVVGTWEFDTLKEDPTTKGIKTWRERASRSPGQLTHRFYPTVKKDGGGQSMVLLRGGNKPSGLRVTGHIEAYERAAIPSEIGLLTRWRESVAGITDTVLDSIELGSLYPVEFNPDTPSLPSVFARDYSFSILFGEKHESALEYPINVRHRGSQI